MVACDDDMVVDGDSDEDGDGDDMVAGGWHGWWMIMVVTI
jgi:hypothetical protein